MHQREKASAPSGIIPAADVARAGTSLVVMLSLPGVAPNDVRLQLSGTRQLVVKGVAPYKHRVPPEQLDQSEFLFGEFERKIDLPLPVVSQGAEISLVNGVLTVRLPLHAQSLEMKWSTVGGESAAHTP